MFNPVAQAKFVHTVGAGYVTGAMFVMAISSYYLLGGRFAAFAKRSIIVASAFGLAAALCVVILGDESGYTVSENQKMKLAAIEGMWQTEPAPAGFNLIGIPDPARKRGRRQHQNSVGARHHRHPLVRPADTGHRRLGDEQRPAHTQWADRL